MLAGVRHEKWNMNEHVVVKVCSDDEMRRG